MSMPIVPDDLVDNATFEIRRPFGSSSAISSGHTGTLIWDYSCGRSGGGGNFIWTHILYVDPNLDIKDNITRVPGGNSLLYSDGDEVRISMAGGYIRYVVVILDNVFANGSSSSSNSGSLAVHLLYHEKVLVS